MPTVKELRKLAKGRKPPIKGYSSLNKTALLSKLGMRDELKQHNLSQGQSKAVKSNAKNIAKGNATTRAIVEGRLKRAVARDLKAAKKDGRTLTQEEKRKIALKALVREAKAIRAGKKEQRSYSKVPPGMTVAEYKQHLRRKHGAETGSRAEVLAKKEARRAEIGLGENADRYARSRQLATKESGYQYAETSAKPKTFRDMRGEKFTATRQKNGDIKLEDVNGSLTISKDFASDLHDAIELARKTGRDGSVDRGNPEKDGYQVKIRVAEQDKPYIKFNHSGSYSGIVGLRTAEKILKTQQPQPTQAEKLPTKGKNSLTNEQQRAIAAHLRKVESGEAQAVPLRAFQSPIGGHTWLEMRGKTGAIGGVPILENGKHNKERALTGDAWEKMKDGMNMVAEFEKKPKAVEKPIKRSEASRSSMSMVAELEKKPKVIEKPIKRSGASRSSQSIKNEIGRLQVKLVRSKSVKEKMQITRHISILEERLANRGRGAHDPDDKDSENSTASSPWAGNSAGLQIQPRAKTIRGRTID